MPNVSIPKKKYAFLDVDGTLIIQKVSYADCKFARIYNDKLIEFLKKNNVTDVVLVTNHSVSKLGDELENYISNRGNATPPVTRQSVIKYLKQKGIDVPYVVLPETSAGVDYYENTVKVVEGKVDKILDDIKQPLSNNDPFEKARDEMGSLFKEINIKDKDSTNDSKKSMIALAKKFVANKGYAQEKFMFFDDVDGNIEGNISDKNLIVYKVDNSNDEFSQEGSGFGFEVNKFYDDCEKYINSKRLHLDFHGVKGKIRKAESFIKREEKNITIDEVYIILNAIREGGSIKTDNETLTFPEPGKSNSLRIKFFGQRALDTSSLPEVNADHPSGLGHS